MIDSITPRAVGSYLHQHQRANGTAALRQKKKRQMAEQPSVSVKHSSQQSRDTGSIIVTRTREVGGGRTHTGER